MHQPPQGESIWGNINTAMEIALDVYAIVAKDKNGIERTGIMVGKETADKNLSAKAAAMAEQDGDWLCYDEDTKDVPMYEILQRRVAACRKMEAAALREMEEIKRDDRTSLSDYFGECAPPAQTQHGAVVDTLKVRNGIYFTQDSQEMQLAIHEAIADNYMSPIAGEFGRKQGEYLLYDMETCAIPLGELKNVFEETERLVISEESLYATLNQHFRGYVAAYNGILPEEYKIPEQSAAPADLFLAMQLESAMKSEQAATAEGEQISHSQSAEPDFNEESDFEIGG